MTIDQLGNSVPLPADKLRIISLVPSQTELLADLGLDAEVIGITKFCVHPEHWRRSKTIVGGTKEFRFEVIDGLQPNLIIGNKEENYAEGIHKLRSKYPVWMSDIAGLADALEMIASIGTMTGREMRAKAIIREINEGFSRLNKKRPASVLYLIWRNPWMAVGRNTFIHSMLEKMGLVNIIKADRYPELTALEIEKMAPEIILLPSEPFPFGQKHADELHDIVPGSRKIMVDGEMFSWYGSRLAAAPQYFNNLEI